ncbi:sensor histidine kinase [Gaoshiqia sp. Z1-71]|uniref:sensor histidine kinase n=1 Tax=Gaoshiqia hydrogeniformans TaxID=3290090 RepID=UPI003BF7B758
MFKSTPDRKIAAMLHITAWIIVITIPLYLSNTFGAGGHPHRLYQFFVHSFSAAIIFYVGYLWLVPAFFLQERKLTYLVALIGLILVTYFITSFINEYFLHDALAEEKFRAALKKLTDSDSDIRPPMKAFGFYNHVIVSVLISGFAIGLCGMEKLEKEEKKQKELEKEKLNSELAFLKNQVSPHFFFNTLNNIYSLIGIDAADAQDAVLKLSKLMRYLLYESEQGLTGLNDEIAFMNNYIDLMKLRLNAKVDLSVSFPGNTENLNIPPLLFIPFIENAFKHGISYREPSFIDIKMTVDGTVVYFSTRNSIGASSHPGDGQYSGIGLENVKKRLSLLFPGKHTLKIEQTDAEFRIDLRLETKTTATT